MLCGRIFLQHHLSKNTEKKNHLCQRNHAHENHFQQITKKVFLFW